MVCGTVTLVSGRSEEQAGRGESHRPERGRESTHRGSEAGLSAAIRKEGDLKSGQNKLLRGLGGKDAGLHRGLGRAGEADLGQQAQGPPKRIPEPGLYHVHNT